jgi:hypothetical protein
MKHPLTLAGTALLLVACSDSPVAPAREAPAPPSKAAFDVSEATALDFTDLSNDMIERLLPSFDNQEVAANIERSIRELNARAMAGDLAAARAASQSIRSSLQGDVASALLLDVMNRTLDVVDRGLGSASAGSTASTLMP